MELPDNLDKLPYPDYVKERARIIDEWIAAQPEGKRPMLQALQAEVVMERALAGDIPEVTMKIISDKIQERYLHLQRIKHELKGLMDDGKGS